MNALKCDRCGRYYEYDPTVRYNYICFGHKDIIPSKKIITKDICPECMEKFMCWLEHPKAIFTVTDVEFEKEERTDEDDDERVNELYKEAEDISNSAGEEKVE